MTAPLPKSCSSTVECLAIRRQLREATMPVEQEAVGVIKDKDFSEYIYFNMGIHIDDFDAHFACDCIKGRNRLTKAARNAYKAIWRSL